MKFYTSGKMADFFWISFIQVRTNILELVFSKTANSNVKLAFIGKKGAKFTTNSLSKNK